LTFEKSKGSGGAGLVALWRGENYRQDAAKA